ncbi:MAG: TolC family protein [bacterium]|nr:TolC family protein [bacterium]
MRTCRRLLLTLILALAAVLPAAGDEVRIGVVFDGESSTTEQLFGQVKGEILTLTEGEFDVRFDDADILTGDWTERSINASIEVLLADPEIDLVIALGPIASHTFCCREVLPKPVIAAIVLDSALQDLPRDGGTSGVHNLNYLAFPSSFERDLDQFLEIVPFSRLTVVFNKWFLNVVPELEQQLRQVVTDRGMDFHLIAVGDSVDEALAAIPEAAEAVYMAPLLHLSDDDRDRFIEGVNKRYLPSFSLFGVAEVSLGVLAGQRDVAFYERLARRVALNVQRILLGEEAGDIPVAFADRRRLAINMETARTIGVFPPWHLLDEAELLNEKVESFPVLSLREAVEKAVDANLDLAAKAREVAAGAQVVRQARAALWPQIDVSLSGVKIDSDRASMDFSAQAERTWSGGVTLTQLIYSDPALANVAIQGYAQLTREQEIEQLRLDIVQETMVVYMNVLLAQTLQEIRKSNLELSRSNLELAQVRRAVGDAGPGEVYRWESEVASARRDLVEAGADTYRARLALQQLMHQRQEEGFQTEDLVLDELMNMGDFGAGAPADNRALFRSGGQVLAYTSTPLHFEIFRYFMVDEGLSRSPELAQLDAAIETQGRILKSARRSFWSPEIALQGQLDHTLSNDGEVPVLVAGFEDTSWSLALQGTLSIFSGGSKRAEVIEAEETLADLKLQREALAERLEQLIRSNLFVTNTSFSSIRLSRQAADAARKNLEVVTDSYSQGVVDILDLLDAQNAALSAELDAASSLYQFFIDLIDVERSVNWFEVERTPQEQVAWLGRIREFFSRHGLKPRPGRGPIATGEAEER